LGDLLPFSGKHPDTYAIFLTNGNRTKPVAAMKLGQLSIVNPYLMAPMAGHTDLGFRLFVRTFGCELAYTEMISAEGLTRGSASTRSLLRTEAGDHPLAVQLFGSKPEVLAQAAVLAEEAGADIIDINMGCPVKKVIKTGAGAALLKDLKKVELLLRAVRKSTALPLTIKIRSGWNPENPVYLPLARIAEECGISGLAFHPRWANQGFSGNADWSLLKELKERSYLPIIGNGDITTPEEAISLKKSAGCDGIMIGRQALKTPWIFKQIKELEGGQVGNPPSLSEREVWLSSYWCWILENTPKPAQVKALKQSLFILTRGLPDSGGFRQKVASTTDPEALEGLFRQYLTSLEKT
jgi:tRNA-dihydrouridine synthase B